MEEYSFRRKLQIYFSLRMICGIELPVRLSIRQPSLLQPRPVHGLRLVARTVSGLAKTYRSVAKLESCRDRQAQPHFD